MKLWVPNELADRDLEHRDEINYLCHTLMMRQLHKFGCDACEDIPLKREYLNNVIGQTKVAGAISEACPNSPFSRTANTS